MSTAWPIVLGGRWNSVDISFRSRDTGTSGLQSVMMSFLILPTSGNVKQ